MVRRGASFQADDARRQTGKELKNLRSTNTPTDHDHAIRIDAVNLKHRLRNIETDRANFAHGRLPSMWFVSTQPHYGTRCRGVGAVHHIIHVGSSMSGANLPSPRQRAL